MFVLTLLASALLFSSETASGHPHTDCHLFTDCSACHNAAPATRANCQWCETDEPVVRFCAGPSECAAPYTTVNATCPGERSFTGNSDFCATFSNNCTACGEAAGCGWCSLPFTSSLDYCADETQCHGLWRSQTPCPPEQHPPQPLPHLDADEPRCRKHRVCGDCVSEYLCSWCTTENDRTSGFCVGGDDPAWAQQCETLGGYLEDQDCTCEGWSSCGQCRARGCAWCGSNEADNCFDPSSPQALHQCTALPGGHVEWHCDAQQAHYQRMDPVYNHTTSLWNTTIDDPSERSDKATKIIVVLATVFAVTATAMLMLFVGIVYVTRYKPQPL